MVGEAGGIEMGRAARGAGRGEGGGGGGRRSNLVFCVQSAATVINIGHEEGGDERGIENYERRRLGGQNI